MNNASNIITKWCKQIVIHYHCVMLSLLALLIANESQFIVIIIQCVDNGWYKQIAIHLHHILVMLLLLACILGYLNSNPCHFVKMCTRVSKLVFCKRWNKQLLFVLGLDTQVHVLMKWQWAVVGDSVIVCFTLIQPKCEGIYIFTKRMNTRV